MSLRARLLAASLLLVTIGLAVADVATYRALRSFLIDRVDAQLSSADASVRRALLLRNGAVANASLRQLGAVAPGVFVHVRDDEGRALVTLQGRGTGAPPSAPRLPASLAPLAGETTTDGANVVTLPAAEPGGPRYRVRVGRVFGGVVAVALPLDETYATLHRLLLIEILVTLAVVGAAAALGAWLVRLGLRPLADIEATATSITTGGLGHRVARDDSTTEVGRVGHALNVMLDRIDVAFAERRASEEAARDAERRMRRFVADASHELRTPVAAVRAYAELYRLGAKRRPADLARLLARIELESERMGTLVDDLLLLTRLDEGRPLARDVVDVGAVATEAVDAARAMEPQRPTSLDIAGSVEVTGDRDRLRQVVDNLLSNVRAHTPPSAALDVRVFAEQDSAVLEVADDGPGVDGEDIGRIFERFYRADPARARDRGGAGLGLSIVAAIATAHGGSASAEPRESGGAVFRVHLPLLGAG